MEFSAQQIADFLKGTIVGNPDVRVSNFSKIEEGTAGTLSFLSNPKYEEFLYITQASIVLVNKDFTPEKEVFTTLIKVDDAYRSLAFLLSLVEQSKPKKTGISPLAYVDETAVLGENIYVAPFAYISANVKIEGGVQIFPHVFIGENVKIGNNCTFFAGVKIYDNCVLGNDCILHAGAVLGSDGFGFAPESDGSYKKIPQIGNVVIEDNVEIGANATIDCATIGSTIIRRGVKIDNLVHLAHNVEVGEHTAMAAQTGIAGSTKIGKNCIFAGQVGVAGHLTVADRTIFGAQTGVSHSIKKAGEVQMGAPAMEAARWRKVMAASRSLPDMRNEIIALRKEIEELKKKL
ncbi:MAG: UDP-3-O-(3-hydroxymyristoyl)glucosamine N-acyltransferase [Prevotellaceae bacterium]|jgi:UDP-3-O-[3-hydroxymyristoyl] glucosamine N-acyltransferase|nr:UDP-3-O-(3-hydroxymyristoyl)glucosamine N-acyltransferase [Prevotellaceae bacterium]